MKFLKKISFVYMADTPWDGFTNDKLYLLSGQFSSTIRDSEPVGSIDTKPWGITWDGTNSPWAGGGDDKLYLTSGQFTSTLKTSQYIGDVSLNATGMSWDGTNSPWCDNTDNRLQLQSGQFSSTIKTSRDISGIDDQPAGISYDGTNTPWAGEQFIKLYLQSGQFSSTVKTSRDVTGIDVYPTGISWDGSNTPWAGGEANRLYLQSGQFSSTIKTSQDVSGVDAPTGICTNDVDGRLVGNVIYEPSVESTLSLGQSITVCAVYPRPITSSISLGQSITYDNIYPRSMTSSLSLGQSISPSGSIYSRPITSSLSLGQSISSSGSIYSRSLTSSLSLGQSISSGEAYLREVISSLVFNYSITPVYTPLYDCLNEVPRWIFASVTKHFNLVAVNNGLHFYIEGTHRETKDEEKYIEFRMDGPHLTQLNNKQYRFDIEINILWSFLQDHEDFHETERIKGILLRAMSNICVYKYGDGPFDDDSYLEILQLQQDGKTPTRVNNFGQVRSDVKLMQGTVEGSYKMSLHC